jgi:hypothetical protein
MLRTGKQISYFRNLATAKRIWSVQINQQLRIALKSLSENHGLSVAAGDLQLMENGWYVTHSGLIRLAQRKGCCGIHVNLITKFSDWASGRWVFKATVYKKRGDKTFVGYGDADPSNISQQVRGAEMRIAETRAVNRALRKAYGIGHCSVEELRTPSMTPMAQQKHEAHIPDHSTNGRNNGQPRLRDQLSALIRRHGLDATLVKSYAADFCGTVTLSGASRELVESFISHLSTAANENRDGLICKLNSYARPSEAQR